MFEHKKIQRLEDYFLPLASRREKGVYFYRINQYSEETGQFLRKYYETARRFGVIIEGRIPNPDEKNLSYYEEVMGLNFQLSMGFLTASLKKWLPRMKDCQRNNVAGAIYDSLDILRRSGKNENMQKNAYIKFMCWLYYKFERVVNHLGEETVPKLLYEGEISKYELMLLSILSHAGCDIILLQYKGDGAYLKSDPQSRYSEVFQVPGGTSFPDYFNLKWLRNEMLSQANTERLYGTRPRRQNCTNAWIEGNGFEDIKKEPKDRGSDPNLFYNCLIRINGAEDKLIYENELYQFQLAIKKAGRKLMIVDEGLTPPSPEEIGKIKRKNISLAGRPPGTSQGASGGYASQDQMILDLAGNIRASNRELQLLMHKAFVDILLEAGKTPGISVSKLTNKAVYLLCWLNRCQPELFSGWNEGDISCFILLGGCRNENEALFLKFLSHLPTDVLVLKPDLGGSCVLQDNMLYEINYPDSIAVNTYPTEDGGRQVATAAYHAERELDSILYQDSGMYRNRQYGRANTVTLQTTYEEIGILWDQELKYRPSFSTIEGAVSVPVLCAKVSGVKDGQVQPYWSGIKELITQDTLVIRGVPFLQATDANPMKACAAEFFKNGKLLRAKIKAHKNYPYGYLRDEMQEHILDKLQFLIQQKTIRGTFETGTEYAIIAVVLNLRQEIVRMIQKFDFTKKNPKLIYLITAEAMLSLEDSILAAFLNLIGFDILFFVPTGYQSVEKYFNRKIMEEHQIGEYLYDLQVPDFSRISSGTRPSWRDKLFRRGK